MRPLENIPDKELAQPLAQSFLKVQTENGEYEPDMLT